MTQQEMDMVISAAIRFGQNTDMSGELHNVKMLNLELQEETTRYEPSALQMTHL